MPPSILRLVLHISGRHQIWLSLLSVVVFFADTIPIEVQRRLVNAAVKGGDLRTVLMLAGIFAALALGYGLLKFGLNVYRGWVGEVAVRWLRTTISKLAQAPETRLSTGKAGGVEIAMVIAEADPIGSFVGSSFSEPLLQGGVLLTVFSYLIYLQPLMALVGVFVFLPQLILIPLLQGAINRRVKARIWILRKMSVSLVETAERDELSNTHQAKRIERVFRINVGVYQYKFGLNFLMNLLTSLGTAVILGIGGYLVINGQTEIGTVVAFVSGLAKMVDPWGDLINWYRDYKVTEARYSLVVSSLRA